MQSLYAIFCIQEAISVSLAKCLQDHLFEKSHCFWSQQANAFGARQPPREPASQRFWGQAASLGARQPAREPASHSAEKKAKSIVNNNKNGGNRAFYLDETTPRVTKCCK